MITKWAILVGELSQQGLDVIIFDEVAYDATILLSVK